MIRTILLSGALAVASASCDKRADAPGDTPADTNKVQTPKTVEPDNTGVNERDRSGDTLTPLDQKESEADLEITQRIRQSLVGDDALSFIAENVKVITRDGVVTLRGPVKSGEEKAAVEAKARQVAGVKRVDNQLEIAPD